MATLVLEDTDEIGRRMIEPRTARGLPTHAAVGLPREKPVNTGPRPLSFVEAVEDLAEATDRTIRYVRVSTERYVALLAEQDVPEEFVVRLTRVLTELLDGRNARARAESPVT